MSLLYKVAYPFIAALDPETAHGLTIRSLEKGVAGAFFNDRRTDPPALGIERFGIRFPNPIGLAAGFDKQAEVVDRVLDLGFGFVEAGTVTPLAQPGNPKPRLFRLSEDKAVINRFGFNSEGLMPFRERLAQRPRGAHKYGIVGANLGANKESEDRPSDYVKGLKALSGLVEYFTINVSSPNTPGLRGLQDREELIDLIDQLREVGVREPLLLKIAPDVTVEELGDICAVVLAKKMDGLIVSNTTISRPDGLKSALASEGGGLSGAPLFDLSTERLALAYRMTQGQVPLVGVGGVSSGRQAYEKILKGASLVQLYSAMVYKGPGLVKQIKRDLVKLLKADGYTSVEQAIGQKIK